jgi:hypothetical protein
MRAVNVFAFQVIDFLVYLFVVFNQLTRRRLITISYLLVISESAKSAAQVFRVLVRLRAQAGPCLLSRNGIGSGRQIVDVLLCFGHGLSDIAHMMYQFSAFHYSVFENFFLSTLPSQILSLI